MATDPTVAPAALIRERRRTGEAFVKVGLGVAATISVLTTVGIIVALLIPAVEFFREHSIFGYLSGTEWTPLFNDPKFGVIPLLAGTLSVTFWASLVGLPLGLGTAIYLSEYARPRTRAVIKPVLEVLAGIPTVVFGYFALTWMTPRLRDIGLDVEILNVLSGGLVMGIMLIPIVASLSEDAMSAVPHDLRQGAYALGARTRTVATKIVVPAAISGIIASFVLAISRAVGETMIVAIAVGGKPCLTFDPQLGCSTITGFIAATAQGDVPPGSVEYKTIFALGLTLFVVTFAMNFVAIRLVRRFREVYE